METSTASPADGLNVAVIGAGIAGLAAAVSLCRVGHHVTIYERSQFKNEVGAAITMPPQASRILRRWGIAGRSPTCDDLYQDIAAGAFLLGSRRRDAKTAELVIRMRFDEAEPDYGAPFISYHRADLHSALRKVADELGAKIVLGKMAVAIDCSKATVNLADPASGAADEPVQSDLIIIADGVNSRFVKDITGVDNPVKDTGRSAYRALIPTERLMADKTASQIFEDGGERFMNGTASLETGVFMIAYPCRRGELMNVAIMHPTRPEQKGRNDWDSPATIDEALQTIADFHPAYKAIIECSDPKIYNIRHREPLRTYVNGRAIIIGDAAHSMFPTLAGGGSTALEDAAALEILLKDIKPSDSILITQRLALWNALRLPRDVVTQVLSTVMVNRKPASQFVEQLRHVYTGHLPDQVLAGWHEGSRAFVCPYDVFDVTKKAMEWAEREGYPEDMMMRLQDEGIIKHFLTRDVLRLQPWSMG